MKTARCVNGFPKPFKVTDDYRHIQHYIFNNCSEPTYKKRMQRWRKSMRKINADRCWGEYSWEWQYGFTYVYEPPNVGFGFDKFVKDLSFIFNGE